MILPSKELLSAVLGLEVFDIYPEEYPKQHGNVVYFKTNSRGILNEEDFHNIYELAHLCKEWINKLGYDLLTGPDTYLKSYIAYINLEDTDTGIYSLYFEKAETEPEAIFEACEYILTAFNTKDSQ